MSVAQRSSSTTCHSADGQDARMSATGIRPLPTAVITSCPGADRAVLHVQVADPAAEAAEQGGHVLPADRRPVGVDLEDHRRVEPVGEHLERGPAADDGRQLEVVVVVAEAQPVVRGLDGGLVELLGQAGDPLGVGETLGRHYRHDDGAAADRAHPAQQHLAVLAEDVGVHGAHGQPGLVQVGPELLRVGPHVVGLDRAVAELRDAPQDFLPARRKDLAEGVKLQGRRTADQRATLLAGNHFRNVPAI